MFQRWFQVPVFIFNIVHVQKSLFTNARPRLSRRQSDHSGFRWQPLSGPRAAPGGAVRTRRPFTLGFVCFYVSTIIKDVLSRSGIRRINRITLKPNRNQRISNMLTSLYCLLSVYKPQHDEGKGQWDVIHQIQTYSSEYRPSSYYDALSDFLFLSESYNHFILPSSFYI